MKKVYLNEFTTEELKNRFDKGEIDSAITIFGSCESHGPHLPLGPDLFVPKPLPAVRHSVYPVPLWYRACRSALPRTITVHRWRLISALKR